MWNSALGRLTFFFMFFCMTCCPLEGIADTHAPVSENVALVNGTAITRISFQQEVKAVQAQIRQSGKQVDAEIFEKIQREILDELIDSELLYQASQKEGLKISSADIEKEILNVRRRFPSEKAFQRGLEKLGMTMDEMKEKLIKSLTIETFITQHITRDISVAETEIRNFYDSRPELFESPEYVRASHILITVPDEAEPSVKKAAQNKLKEIEDRLKNGEDFAELALKYSDGPSKDNGGDIGFFERGEVKAFEDAAFDLPTGQISSIVKTRFGYHLIKTTDRMQDPPIPYQTAQYDIRKKLELEKSKQCLDEYLKKIRPNAKIEIYR